MKGYFEEENSDRDRSSWMPLFISLLLVLITFFIFFVTYTKGSKLKIRKFREHFRKSLMITGEGGKGVPSVTDLGTPDNPARTLINRMKSNGINKKLMDEFLTLNQIKELVVRDGQRGVSIIVPEVVGFVPEKNQLTESSLKFLDKVSMLVYQLPYLVEIKGYSTSIVPPGYKDALEFSAKRAAVVYRYFLGKGIPPEKLKVSGCGDAFKDSGVPQNKVEIIFKTEDI